MERDKFASDEEWYFSWYVQELLDAGILIEAEYQPAPFKLCNEAVLVGRGMDKKGPYNFTKTLLNDLDYNPDWKLTWSDNCEKFVTRIDRFISKDPFNAFLSQLNGLIETWVDVKGASVGMNNSSAVTFPIKQKMVYDKFGIYIQKIIPVYYTKNKRGEKIPYGLFPDTFTPERFLYQNVQAHKRALHYTPRSLEEFLLRPA